MTGKSLGDAAEGRIAKGKQWERHSPRFDFFPKTLKHSTRCSNTFWGGEIVSPPLGDAGATGDTPVFPSPVCPSVCRPLVSRHGAVGAGSGRTARPHGLEPVGPGTPLPEPTYARSPRGPSAPPGQDGTGRIHVVESRPGEKPPARGRGEPCVLGRDTADPRLRALPRGGNKSWERGEAPRSGLPAAGRAP